MTNSSKKIIFPLTINRWISGGLEKIFSKKYNRRMKHNRKDIPYCMPYIGEQEINEVVKVLRGKWITTGAEVKQFEERVKKYLGVKSAVAVSSGTAALEISLAVQGIGPGDEVLTTAYTFASTALAIIHRGGTPVFADVEPDTFNLDPKKVNELIDRDYKVTPGGLQSKKSQKYLRGIITVHFGGQPSEIEQIRDIAATYRLFVIEDAAHAIGAIFKGKKIGMSPNLVCFSFYSNKNLTTGEGGMIVTDNEELEPVLRRYSLHGISKNAAERYRKGLPFYDIVCPGFKANLSDIQAALGVIQIRKLDRINRLRNRVADWYDECFQGAAGVTTPVIREYNYSSRHLYPILLSPQQKAFRDEVIIRLRKRGIYPSVHFIPVHFHSFFKAFLKDSVPSLPVTEDLFQREISLPIFPELKKSDVNYVADTLQSILKTFTDTPASRRR
jgi:dTDP-4-amino-4,6-dideoxygalactose transaminase